MPNRINKGKSPPRHNQSKTVQNKANRKDLKKQSKSKDKTSTITSWQIDGETTEQRQTLFSLAPKSLQMVTAAMKLKDSAPWKKSNDHLGQHIEKKRHYFANKGQ